MHRHLFIHISSGRYVRLCYPVWTAFMKHKQIIIIIILIIINNLNSTVSSDSLCQWDYKNKPDKYSLPGIPASEIEYGIP